MTLFFSQDSVSTIAHVIPTIDCLNSALSGTNSQSLSPPIKDALKLAWASINKYYSKTDMLNVYHITISKYTIFVLSFYIKFFFVVLHSNLKLKYFHKHSWEKAWVDTAESITCDEYKKYATLKESKPSIVSLFIV